MLSRKSISFLSLICLIGLIGLMWQPGVVSAAYDPNNLIPDDAFIATTTMDQAAIERFLTERGGLAKIEPNRLGAGSKSSATIINESAKAAGLNPQVILVTLQKEQSLVTSQTPTQRAIDFAMGFGVYPGSPYIEPGHPLYAGSFLAQVEQGAKVLRAHFDNGKGPGTSKVGETIDMQIKEGDTATKKITLSNRATAALYRYTPYVENGNKNFANTFEGWFGTYGAELVTQGPTQGPGAAGFILTPGEQFTISARFRNTGSTTWKNSGGNTIKLGASQPTDRSSAFLGGTSRAATLKENEVKPGEIGTFEARLTAPTTPGTYQEFFQLLAEGLYWFGPTNVHWTFAVGTLDGRFVTQLGTWSDGRFHVQPGQPSHIQIQYQSTGSARWLKKHGSLEANLGTWQPMDRKSPFLKNGGRAANLNEPELPTGAIGTFEFDITAPANPGVYREVFRPVIEGVSWIADPVIVEIVVEPYIASLTGQSATTYTLKPGDWVKAWVTYKNTGVPTWDKTSFPVSLGTFEPQDRPSPFLGGGSRASTVNELVVKPGESAGFEILLTAPSKPGRYREVLRPVAEGSHWFGQPVLFIIDVKP